MPLPLLYKFYGKRSLDETRNKLAKSSIFWGKRNEDDMVICSMLHFNIPKSMNMDGIENILEIKRKFVQDF